MQAMCLDPTSVLECLAFFLLSAVLPLATQINGSQLCFTSAWAVKCLLQAIQQSVIIPMRLKSKVASLPLCNQRP